jgi:hypothetical protein
VEQCSLGATGELFVSFGYPTANVILPLGILSAKYFDSVTQTVLTYTYTPFNVALEAAGDNSSNRFANDLFVYGFLNKANPDWKGLVDLSSAQTIGDLTGESTQTLTKAGCQAVFSCVAADGAMINFWWQSRVFAKYAVFAWGIAPYNLPVQFLNFPRCYNFDFDQDYTGFYLNAAPGVTVSVSVYSRLSLPLVTYGAGPVPIPN